MKSSYITVRYYADEYGTRFKIVSDDRTKDYVVFEYIHDNEFGLHWNYLVTFLKFKSAYRFVKGSIENGR